MEQRRQFEHRSQGWRAGRAGQAAICAAVCLIMAPGARAAEEFGDVAVSPNAIYTGNTYHGYGEIRVVVENRSGTRAHEITLVFPNRPSGMWGNCIGRISRTVTVGANGQEVVTLLQPPLPIARGDDTIRVEVDGREAGEVLAPNANGHSSGMWRGGSPAGATVFVSRSLDFDAVTRIFRASSGAFTAIKAVGPPDASSPSRQYNAWMPDTTAYGKTNWLELDYASPQTANRVVVRRQHPAPMAAEITLISAAGTKIKVVGMRSTAIPHGVVWDNEYTFPDTTEPVKTVRLDFGTAPPSTISIDAVQISGPTGSQWASDARASSDNSASAPAYGAAGGPDQVETLRSESPVTDWSEDWLAYSPFDAVVFNAGDLAAMPPGVFAALGNYVHAGGNVVLLGQAGLPAQWHAAQRRELAGGAEFDTGFGRVFAIAHEKPAPMDSQPTERLRQVTRESAQYFQSLPNDNGQANTLMPVVENLKIPARGTVIVMLAFVILIGPVNIFYLSRIKRRTWMLWTIPAISMATTLLVFVYSLVREGVTPTARIAGITVLDQSSHRAATIGAEAFYCPLTPSRGLQFDYTTEATPLVSAYGSGGTRQIDWSQSQHFEHGWILARVPAHFHIRKPEIRRERIQVLNENGKLEAVNSLGAAIKSLWMADADMNLYHAGRIEAGAKGGLVPAKPSQSLEQAGPRGLLGDLGFTANPDSLHDGSKYLLPNTYVAVLEGNPFVENALGAPAGAKRTKSSAVVFGILEPADQTTSAP
jgi:hypothetical protein